MDPHDIATIIDNVLLLFTALAPGFMQLILDRRSRK